MFWTVCTSDICKLTDIIKGKTELRNIPKETEWSTPNYYHFINAKALIENGNYGAAVSLLSHVCEDDRLPRPLTYLALDAYEKCCKETNDYKGAYEVSQAKLQLFEKMMAQVTDDENGNV